MNSKTRIRRHPERSVPKECKEILKDGRVAHVGFCQNGQPYVIPFSYYYNAEEPDRLYLHGAYASRALQCLAKGAQVCIEVTLIEGFVYSRTAIDHSINYRSVVCFGRARLITKNSEKAAIFEKMVFRYFPGRTAGCDYEDPSLAHLEGTALLEVKIEAWSAKARRGGPNGPKDSDKHTMGSAGVMVFNSLV